MIHSAADLSSFARARPTFSRLVSWRPNATRSLSALTAYGSFRNWTTEGVVADYGIDGKPHPAHRVPTGGIAVAGEDFAALYDANGRAIWLLKAGCYGSEMHY